MMYISFSFPDWGYSKEWHIGDPMPEIKGRKVYFAADGDELALILGAMTRTARIPETPEASKQPLKG